MNNAGCVDKTPTQQPSMEVYVMELDSLISFLNDQNMIYLGRVRSAVGQEKEPCDPSPCEGRKEDCAKEAIENRLASLRILISRYENLNQQMSTFV